MAYFSYFNLLIWIYSIVKVIIMIIYPYIDSGDIFFGSWKFSTAQESEKRLYFIFLRNLFFVVVSNLAKYVERKFYFIHILSQNK